MGIHIINGIIAEKGRSHHLHILSDVFGNILIFKGYMVNILNPAKVADQFDFGRLILSVIIQRRYSLFRQYPCKNMKLIALGCQFFLSYSSN